MAFTVTAAPVAKVITPGVEQFLVSGRTVDLSVTTPQALFVVPPGLTAHIESVSIHNPSVTVSAAQASSQTFGFTVGFDSVSAVNVLPAVSVLAPASAQTATFPAGQFFRAVVADPTATTGVAGHSFGNPGDTLYIKFAYAGGNAPPTGTQIRVGVMGHLATTT